MEVLYTLQASSVGEKMKGETGDNLTSPVSTLVQVSHPVVLMCVSLLG